MALDLPSHRATGLVDVLDRVLDKGLVIAGDIKVSLAEDLSPGGQRRVAAEHEELQAQVRQLERKVEALTAATAVTTATAARSARRRR